MTIEELDQLILDVDRFSTYRPYGVTKSTIEKLKLALAELIEVKRQNGDART